jgi:prepilin peptidase CpaA
LNFIYLFLLSILTIAAVTDCRARRIPNWLTLPAIIGGLVYHTTISGFEGFLFSIEGLILGFTLLIIFYLAGGMGAGDIKLMGAVGSLLGPKGVFFVFLYAAIVGGIIAIILLWWNSYLNETINRYVNILRTFLVTQRIIYIPPDKKQNLPALCYGVIIGIGSIFYILKDIAYRYSFF